jgi:chromosome partitioning protein
MARVIAVCNQKGGVGKTTTAVNLAAYLAAHGRRTLLVDFDPQGNASSALGATPHSLQQSVYHGVLGLAHPRSLVRPSALMNLHFVAAAPHLTGLRVELIGMHERDRALRRMLNALRHEYSYIVIDLPPSMDLLFVNGLVAADEIIVPVQAEYYSLEGLGQLLATVDMIRKNLSHDLSVAGALLTMHDASERFSREVAANLRAHFPHRVFRTEIPRSVALAEAPSFGKPVLLHRPDSDGARAYRDLAREVIGEERGI